MSEAGPERLDVAVLLPRPDKLADAGLAPSEAAFVRRQHLAGRDSRRAPTGVWRPSRPVSEVFQSLGFEPPVSATRNVTGATVQSGAVQRLESLGGFVIYERRGQMRLDDLRQEFGDDFLIARDSRVFQQSARQPDAAGAPDADDEGWHPDTGVHDARKMKVTGERVRFGVVDTGIDADHNDFQKHNIPFLNVPYREDVPPVFDRRGFDNSGHGSNIASILAGRQSGIARGARLHMAAVAEGHSLTSHMRRIVRGFDWLYDMFRAPKHRTAPIIINLSLGFDSEAPPSEDAENYATLLDMIKAAIELMVDVNMLVLAAIGNDGEGRFRLPAALPEVIGVGAVDWEAQEIMPFSGSVPSSGKSTYTGPDIVGIGANVLGAAGRNTSGDSLYARWEGTSQATAYAAGIAALYWSMDPRMGAVDVRDLLFATAKPVPRGQEAGRWGRGMARFDPPPELVREHHST